MSGVLQCEYAMQMKRSVWTVSFRTFGQCCFWTDETGPRGTTADRTIPLQAEKTHGKPTGFLIIKNVMYKNVIIEQYIFV